MGRILERLRRAWARDDIGCAMPANTERLIFAGDPQRAKRARGCAAARRRSDLARTWFAL
jgi:hypothetical protein